MIIIDRKKKRANFDNQWSDPLGIEEARKNKAVTIEIPKDSKNPAHLIMASFGAKSLIGKTAYCFNSKKDIVSGRIVDIIPPHFIHLRNKGVFKLDDIVSIGGIDG